MPPKTLSEIIEAVKSGEKPDYDDLRFGFLVLNYLHAFDSQDMLEVFEKSTDALLKWKAEESFNRSKRVMTLPPKQYLGDNWNPDHAAYQEERQLMKRLLDKVLQDREDTT